MQNHKHINGINTVHKTLLHYIIQTITVGDDDDDDDDDIHGYMVEDMYDDINFAVPSPTNNEHTSEPVTTPSVEPLIPAQSSQTSLGTSMILFKVVISLFKGTASNEQKGYLEINRAIISDYTTRQVYIYTCILV